MTQFNGTPHNSAKLGDFAKTVLMPGDPLRAKHIAETFLENAREVNRIRGMLAYTGTYKGKEVSVMGHGMGIPSVGIYSYELYKFYGVENIIRIGSCGSKLPPYTVIVGSKGYSHSSYAKVAFGYEENFMLPSPALNDALIASAEKLGKTVHVGPLSSGDNFYIAPEAPKLSFPEEVIGLEMESFGLFANARYLGKNAACIVTVSDSHDDDGNETDAISPEARQTAMNDMIRIALETAISL
ncbi:MAG: purine-nucleoside phosphorylase [Clostridiales bacterium]|nr:purine-nucleoside phosphorylase [Clostridiales bacterium]MBQ3107721.1 purine-nucleoside phosphorylase [Bacillota bacterium]